MKGMAHLHPRTRRDQWSLSALIVLHQSHRRREEGEAIQLLLIINLAGRGPVVVLPWPVIIHQAFPLCVISQLNKSCLDAYKLKALSKQITEVRCLHCLTLFFCFKQNEVFLTPPTVLSYRSDSLIPTTTAITTQHYIYLLCIFKLLLFFILLFIFNWLVFQMWQNIVPLHYMVIAASLAEWARMETNGSMSAFFFSW